MGEGGGSKFPPFEAGSVFLPEAWVCNFGIKGMGYGEIGIWELGNI